MGEQGLAAGSCEHMISPGTLHMCRIYRRNEEQRPEKCWDSELVARLTGDTNPARRFKRCPNNTLRSRPRDEPVTVGLFQAMADAIAARQLQVVMVGDEEPLEEELEAEVDFT